MRILKKYARNRIEYIIYFLIHKQRKEFELILYFY